MWMKVRNTFIIFLVSGFWHGANWTFIVWGLLNAIYIMPSIIFNTNRTNLDSVAQGKLFPTLKEFFSIILTFSLTVLAWIFFRSATIDQALGYISRLFSASFFSFPVFKIETYSFPVFILVILFIVIEWMGREQQYAIANIFSKRPRVYRWMFYYLIVIIIFVFAGSNQQFIYFQF
jgi:hypothetical protein